MNPKNINPMPIPQTTQKSKAQKRLIIVAAVTIVIACVATFFYYRHQAKEQAYQADKARFAQVETDMKTAYDAMVAAAGVPDVSKHEKGCGRPNLKYVKGSLFCNVTYTFAYGERNLDGAYKHTKALQDAVAQDGYRITSRNNAEAILQSNSQSLRIGLSKQAGITCNLSYDYGNPQLYEGFEGIDSKTFSLYQFRCTKNVDREIY